MTTVLITGMSGTGKSTVMSILGARGYTVIETDNPGWCVPADGDWNTPENEWIWDEARIAGLLDHDPGSHLFVDGCRPNQGKFYDRFDHIVVLTAPIEVMLDRVANRLSNPFGASLEDQEAIRRDKREIEPLLIEGADMVFDTSATPPEQLADRLVALLRVATPEPPEK